MLITEIFGIPLNVAPRGMPHSLHPNPKAPWMDVCLLRWLWLHLVIQTPTKLASGEIFLFICEPAQGHRGKCGKWVLTTHPTDSGVCSHTPRGTSHSLKHRVQDIHLGQLISSTHIS